MVPWRRATTASSTPFAGRRARGPPLPPAFDAYLEKVRDGAFRVTDEDVRELVDAGFSEDEIFEHTVATAVAAGLDRLDAGLRTLG